MVVRRSDDVVQLARRGSTRVAARELHGLSCARPSRAHPARGAADPEDAGAAVVDHRGEPSCQWPARRRTTTRPLGGPRCTRFGNFGVPTGAAASRAGRLRRAARVGSVGGDRREARSRRRRRFAFRSATRRASSPSGSVICVVPSSTTSDACRPAGRRRMRASSRRRPREVVHVGERRRGGVVSSRRRRSRPPAPRERTRRSRRDEGEPARTRRRRRILAAGVARRVDEARRQLDDADLRRSLSARRPSAQSRRLDAVAVRQPARPPLLDVRRRARAGAAAAVRVREPEVAAAGERDERPVGRVGGVLRVCHQLLAHAARSTRRSRRRSRRACARRAARA